MNKKDLGQVVVTSQPKISDSRLASIFRPKTGDNGRPGGLTLRYPTTTSRRRCKTDSDSYSTTKNANIAYRSDSTYGKSIHITTTKVTKSSSLSSSTYIYRCNNSVYKMIKNGVRVKGEVWQTMFVHDEQSSSCCEGTCRSSNSSSKVTRTKENVVSTMKSSSLSTTTTIVASSNKQRRMPLVIQTWEYKPIIENDSFSGVVTNVLFSFSDQRTQHQLPWVQTKKHSKMNTEWYGL